MAPEERTHNGADMWKYGMFMIIGIFLYFSYRIISASTVFVSATDSGTRNILSFSGVVTHYLGIAFIAIPLLVGAVLRSDINPYVRVGMVVAGILALAWL